MTVFLFEKIRVTQYDLWLKKTHCESHGVTVIHRALGKLEGFVYRDFWEEKQNVYLGSSSVDPQDIKN